MKQNRSLWAAILRTLSSCKPRLLVALCNIDNIHYVNDLRGQESPGVHLEFKTGIRYHNRRRWMHP
jgi:hypothetical protein